MEDKDMGKSLVEMAADIIQSQCNSTSMTSEEITLSLQNTFNTLLKLQASEVKASLEDISGAGTKIKTSIALSPEKSLQKIQ